MTIHSVSNGARSHVKTQDSLKIAQEIAMQGVKNQDFRFKVIAENISNSESTASTPGGDPYRRKEVVFQQMNNPNINAKTVQVKNVIPDKSDFVKEYDPSHPAADENGIVKKPNVNRVVESVDLITAKNAQKAMLKIYAEGTSMRRLQIDLMR